MAKKSREKFDEFLKSTFLDLVRQGIGRSNACVKVGITRATLSAHIKRYPKFSEELHLAEMDANELVEMALFRTAIGGNVTAQQVWLYNRASERWQDKRNVTVGGDKNNPVQVEWVDTRHAILEALDDDPDAKSRVVEALDKRRRSSVCPGPGDLGS
jgi:hypothetical protein